MKYPNDVNNMYRNTYNAYPLSKVWNFYTVVGHKVLKNM